MINLFGLVNSTGFGIHTRNMLRALQEKGQEVTLTLPYIDKTEIAVDLDDQPLVEKALHLSRTHFDKNNPSLAILNPQYTNMYCGTPAISFAIFETNQLVARQKHMLNHGAGDIIATTTEDHKQILLDNGISKPIEVIHEGVRPDLFNLEPITPKIQPNKFTLMMVGKREQRKNTDLAIKVMLEECRNKETRLIFHTFSQQTQEDAPYQNLKNWTALTNTDLKGFEYQEIPGFAHYFSNGKCELLFTLPTLPIGDMANFYASCHVGVQISSAEGWGLPTCEMAAMGIPMIYTNCWGHKAFMPESELTIKVTELVPAKCDTWFADDHGEWFKVEEEAFRDKLQYVLQNQQEFSQRNPQLSQHILQNYTWANAADQLLNVITKYQ